MDKEIFLTFVTDTLKEHPEWFGDLVNAMQAGLSQALQEERSKSSDLAAGFITLVMKFPAQIKKMKELKYPLEALKPMYAFGKPKEILDDITKEQ